MPPKSQPLRPNRSITDFFQRKGPLAPSSSPAPSAASQSQPSQPSQPRLPVASGSRVAATQVAQGQGSKAATRVVKRQQASSPIPLGRPSFPHLRINKDEIIEISDKSHISISSGSPSPRPVKRPLFPRNGVVLDLTTPEPPVFKPRPARPATSTPIVISSSSESRATVASNASFKRSFISDTDSDVQIVHQPPLKRQKTAAAHGKAKAVPKQPVRRAVPPAPPPTSSSPKHHSPYSRTQHRPSLLQPLPATSSEDEGSLPYTPLVQRQQTAVASNPRVPLSSSNINQRSSGSLVKRPPARSPSGPRSQNASPAQLAMGSTSTILRKKPAPRVVADEDSDFAMDLGMPMDDFPAMDDFLPDFAPMDVNEQPQASTSKAPSPLVRLPSGTPRTPEHAAARSNTSKNSQPRASGSSTSRRVTPQSPKRPSPAQQRPDATADLLRSIEAAVDSGSSSDSELDYDQLMADMDVHASPSDSPPRGARSRVATDVESTSSEHMIDRALEDESPRAARHRARAVVPSGGESDSAGPGHASTEEVSDSEPEGHMPRFAMPPRASTSTAGKAALPSLSAYSSLTSLASTVGSPPRASVPRFPPSAFGSPLTELGSPSSRAASARAPDAHATPVQTRARRAAAAADVKSPTPLGTPRKVLEVVVPPVNAVARAGLKRFNTARTEQTTPTAGTARQARVAQRTAAPQKAPAPAKKDDGGAVIERLLKDARKKEKLAGVEAAAAAINEQHRAEAQRIRDHTRLQEERALNGLPPSSPERLGAADSDEEVLDMKAMEQDSKRLLDSEGQQTFATLVETVGEDEEKGWCARIGYSPLWETVETPDVQAAVPACPAFPDAAACPVLARVVQDPKLLAVFLDVGILPANASVVTWLFETAMLPDDTLSSAAFDRLRSLLRKRDGNFQLSTSVLLRPLIRFGATREAMDAIDPALYDTVEGPNYRPDEKRRDEAMRNWLTAVTELARTGHLVRAETPKLALAIILLALDAHSSRPLFTLAMTTLEHVCAQVLRGSDDAHLELDICRTIWLWAEGAELPVKARILDVVRGGRCLAYLGRRLAHAFLVGLDLRDMETKTYLGLPPLDELIPLVSHTRPPRDGSQTPDGPAPFVISPATDYIAMGHSADLLARALTSTRDYLTSTALATTWVCDLQQIETNITRLAAQIPGGVKGGSLTAASVQQNLESTRLRLAAELQVFKPRQRNVFEYLSSPKKDGSDDDDGSAPE